MRPRVARNANAQYTDTERGYKGSGDTANWFFLMVNFCLFRFELGQVPSTPFFWKRPRGIPLKIQVYFGTGQRLSEKDLRSRSK